MILEILLSEIPDYSSDFSPHNIRTYLGIVINRYEYWQLKLCACIVGRRATLVKYIGAETIPQTHSITAWMGLSTSTQGVSPSTECEPQTSTIIVMWEPCNHVLWLLVIVAPESIAWMGKRPLSQRQHCCWGLLPPSGHCYEPSSASNMCGLLSIYGASMFQMFVLWLTWVNASINYIIFYVVRLLIVNTSAYGKGSYHLSWGHSDDLWFCHVLSQP